MYLDCRCSSWLWMLYLSPIAHLKHKQRHGYDLGVLTSMLDDEFPLEDQPEQSSKKDDLESQLQEMEKRMAMLRKQIEGQKQLPPQPKIPPKIKEVDLFTNKTVDPHPEIPGNSKGILIQQSQSLIHTGDTDSSDDEDNQRPMARTLSECGYQIKQRLAHINPRHGEYIRNKPKPTWNRAHSEGAVTVEKLKADLLLSENYGGIRVMNPLVSSAMFSERLAGRKLLKMSALHLSLKGGDVEGDWVTVGVIVGKSDPKVSSKGSKFSIWKMADLHDCNRVVSVFLFGETHNALWKTSVGTVVGILNANILPQKDNKRGLDEVSLSIDNSLKAMIIGKSKDFGFCRGTKRNGTSCTAVVNKSVCEYCQYHVQSEYKKVSSKRMELQASYSSPEPRGLKERLLRKEQIIYGGISYTATKPEKLASSKKGKDKLTLQSLKLKEKMTGLLENQPKMELLTGPTAGALNLNKFATSKENKRNKLDNMISIKAGDLLKMHAEKFKPKCPVLGKGVSPGGIVNLNSANYRKPVAIDRNELIKMRAVARVQAKTGELRKEDPNAVKRVADLGFRRKVAKRLSADSEDVTEETAAKKQKLDAKSEEMAKLIERKSKYDNLVNEEEDRRQEKYFQVLEKKEMLENKMLSTQKMECTAVSCKTCKYTALSAAEACKSNNHPLAYHKATKRFFKCKDCGKRTVSLSKLPTKCCGGCGGGNFERAAMWAPKKGPILESEQLSIRGDEIKWLGSARA